MISGKWAGSVVRNVQRPAGMTLSLGRIWSGQVGSGQVDSGREYSLASAFAASELLALSHSAVNPLLYIIFSTRAVRAAVTQLCQGVEY